jgi:predicted O-linked N-acetylglucosamine transferase (SPINDLY family)
LTDPYLDPADGSKDESYSEKSVRLPRNYWCYEPLEIAGEVGPAPCLKTGAITFGCFNKFAKVSPPALDAWARILREVEGSRLLMQAPHGPHRDKARQRFAKAGVDPSRVDFVSSTSLVGYFQRYSQIDIALDPFPCAGGTVTCDALWMGVPVVSLAGRTAMGRSGVSILSNAGLGELVATDVDQYVRSAVGLARDADRLTSLRDGVRDRIRHSALMDARQFARDVEAAFRAIWKSWCEA